MKKVLFTLLFNLIFAIKSFAQEIATANIDNNMVGGIKSMDKCWECKLVEGIYTYTFNFVFKMYNILAPIVSTLVLVFLAFWFLWFIWNQVIKSQINFKGGDVFDFLKQIWIKLFTVLFVLTLLSRVPANEIFSYTIDPIMSFGAGFGKWILVETRNENEIMQNYTSAIKNKQLPKYNCDDIKLSANTINMLKVNKVDANDKMNVDTLKNLICITGEYANSYSIGLNLGSKILSRGLIGVAEDYGAEGIRKLVDNFSSFIPQVGWGKVAYIIIKILLVVAKVWIMVGIGVNMLIACIGLFIMIQFMYVGLTFITMILDIVIQLALVGVMMPITIGSWAYADKGLGNLRGKLSGKLFWGVLRCSFRLAFLAISMSISIFLLNELMTSSFSVDSNQTMLSLYDSLGSNDGLWSQGTALNKQTREFLSLLISNTGLLIAMIFTTLVSWMLLRESIKKADSFSSSLYSGVSNDSILDGLKNLTTSSIKYVMGGVKRDVDFYKKMKETKQYMKDEKAKEESTARKSEIKKWEDEIFNEGKEDHLLDVPAEDIVNEYEKIRNFEDNKDTTSEPKEDSKKELQDTNNDKNKEEIENLQSSEMSFISNELASPEFKELSEDKKEKLASAIISDDKKAMLEVSEDDEIARMFETKNLTPMEDDEIIKDKAVTDNLIATDAISDEDLSNPVLKLHASYIRQQIIEEINTLPPNERKEIKKFMALKKKPKLSTKEEKVEFEKQKQIYERLESKVKTDLLAKKKKLDVLMEERKNIKTKSKKESVLTTKNVIKAIKQDELNELNAELEDLNLTDVVKRSYLRRQLKKLQDEISSIDEKNSIELEDEYDEIVDKWRKGKKRRKTKINPLKKQ